jgi:hypothetical protein
VWLFENPLTHFSCLWVQGLSHHSWRACQEFSVKMTQINNVVFAVGALSTPSSNLHSEEQCTEFLRALQVLMARGQSTRVVLSDFLVLADMARYMNHEFKDKFKKLIFTGGSLGPLMSYANSYPEFLTPSYAQRIY